jgi:hypothetical protein
MNRDLDLFANFLDVNVFRTLAYASCTLKIGCIISGDDFMELLAVCNRDA